MIQHEARPPRIFRLDDGRLLLAEGGELFDLSARAHAAGLAADPLELLAGGFFERALFEAERPAARPAVWQRVELEWDGNAPPGTGVPLWPRSVGKVLALGKNFHAHAAEFGEAAPEEPMFFCKLPENLRAHGAGVRVPDWLDGRFDHEAEVAVLVGRAGSGIDERDALAHVAAYTLANDLTARSMQGADRKRGHPWFRSKNLPGSCPIGPCLVPRDYLDAGDLRVTAHVNGAPRQDATTRDWITDVPHALAYLSRHLPLSAGDLVLMGTSEGVGPLEDGDEVVCAADGVGALVTRIARGARVPR